MALSAPVWRRLVPRRTSANTSFCPRRAIPISRRFINAHCGVIAYTAYSAEEMVRGIETLINPQVGVVLLLNTPHNPTGYALTPEQVARINRAVATLRLCAGHGYGIRL